ncbi:2-(hydroxymethyl)glutarate dehydrogenase [Durusdinium trenchii]|uniref:2-(Hydroxymethyl)glutarate dehydrogenase n=1 Tax=Durusdinium trenchii TaxID=1381693 RepID=A0ABP0LFU5_9DINO
MSQPSTDSRPIGVIGLGLLGSALCERLLDENWEVRCYNRTKEKAQPLIERGAVWSDNPLEECERNVICLFNSAAVRECLGGFAGGFRSGQLVVDATTGGPEDANQLGSWLAQSGVDYLESPIAASSDQTRRGQAVAFVGGSEEVFSQNQDLMSTLTAAAHYVGEWGAAAKFKLVNNLILGLNRVALAEGLVLAERLGLEPANTLAVLKQCNAYSGVMDTKGQKMVEGDFATQARLAQHAKDVRIILEEAAKRGLDLPLSKIHLQLLELGETMGLGDLDNSAIVRVLQGEAQPACGVSTPNAVTDFRRLLDDPQIDAVVIATPDHWHAPAAILATQAGKHVYVEKPCSHNFSESQMLLRAAESSGVVAQHGTQQRSRDFTRNAIQQLRDGVIGEVLVAKAWNIQHRGSIGHKQPSTPPSTVDYDLWVGPAEWMPYQENRLHSDWHWWWNFGTGDIGNDGAHELDYARWGLGVDSLPSRINATGGKYFYDDDQQFPDTATCVFEYPGAEGAKTKQLILEMRLWSTNYPMNCDSGVEFYGTEGQMFLSKRGKLQILGPRNAKIEAEKVPRETGFAHFDNFIEAIRGNAKLAAPLVEAHRSIAPVHLANIALKTGRSIEFDPQAEQILGDEEAAGLLGRKYRKGGHWAIPNV